MRKGSVKVSSFAFKKISEYYQIKNYTYRLIHNNSGRAQQDKKSFVKNNKAYHG
jgi:hypothetical protein